MPWGSIGDLIRDLGTLLKGDLSSAIAITPFWQYLWAFSVRSYMVSIAWTILGLKVAWEAWQLYVTRDAGEATPGPMVLIRRTLYAAAAISLSSWGVQWLYTLTDQLMTQIGKINVGQWDHSVSNPQLGWAIFATIAMTIVEAAVSAYTKFSVMGVVTGPMKMYYGIVYGIPMFFALLIWLQAQLRSLELALIYMFGPIIGASSVSDDDQFRRGTLGMLAKEILILTGSSVVQAALNLLVLNLWIVKDGVGPVTSILSIPLFIAILKVPSWLRGMVYGNGGGGMAEQAGQQAFGALNMMKGMPF